MSRCEVRFWCAARARAWGEVVDECGALVEDCWLEVVDMFPEDAVAKEAKEEVDVEAREMGWGAVELGAVKLGAFEVGW